MAKVTRRVRVVISVTQSEEGAYGSTTVDSREFSLPWEADGAKVARLIERTVNDIHLTTDDFHGPVPVEPIELKVTV